MLRVLSRLMRSTQLFRKTIETVCISTTRNLNLMEYQSKELLRDSGVSVQNFAIVDDLTKTSSALGKLRENIYHLYIRNFLFIRKDYLQCFLFLSLSLSRSLALLLSRSLALSLPLFYIPHVILDIYNNSLKYILHITNFLKSL
jgi:hypothetical protein